MYKSCFEGRDDYLVMLGTSTLWTCHKYILKSYFNLHCFFFWTKQDKVVVSLCLASDMKKVAGSWIFWGNSISRLLEVAVPTWASQGALADDHLLAGGRHFYPASKSLLRGACKLRFNVSTWNSQEIDKYYSKVAFLTCWHGERPATAEESRKTITTSYSFCCEI